MRHQPARGRGTDAACRHSARRRKPRRHCFCSTASAPTSSWSEPFLDALNGPEAIIFDVPGVGGSPRRSFPIVHGRWRGLSAQLLDQLGHEQVDVLGVSWGGALAQQFAFQQARRCRRLVLAATSPGSLMVPGKLAVLLKMATPRRYKDPDYLNKVAGDHLRRRAAQLARTGASTSPSCQLVERLRLLSAADRRHRLEQPAVAALVGAADARHGRHRRSDRARRQRPHPGKAHSRRPPGDHRRRSSLSCHQPAPICRHRCGLLGLRLALV